jgi:hypothetical protein
MSRIRIGSASGTGFRFGKSVPISFGSDQAKKFRIRRIKIYNFVILCTLKTTQAPLWMESVCEIHCILYKQIILEGFSETSTVALQVSGRAIPSSYWFCLFSEPKYWRYCGATIHKYFLRKARLHCKKIGHTWNKFHLYLCHQRCIFHTSELNVEKSIYLSGSRAVFKVRMLRTF